MKQTTQANWFDVDRKGLAKLLERRGKEFLVFELLQNAWDEDVKVVTAELRRVAGAKRGRRYVLIVQDDDPEGFTDLAHAYTLFADSAKKVDVHKRGRFNLGEKLVLALCESATIVTTKGTVQFNRSIVTVCW